MNRRDAKILALETIANSVDILIELDSISNAIKSEKDSSLINEAFDEISNSLLKRVERLKKNNLNNNFMFDKKQIIHNHHSS